MSLGQQALESGHRPSRLRRHLPTQPTGAKISRTNVTDQDRGAACSAGPERKTRKRIQLIPNDRGGTLQTRSVTTCGLRMAKRLQQDEPDKLPV
ncbi:hypothetical protein VTP01DRAFT_354 [Rhizomucor pusillus]|uniref:uncharacterized protein n=1 Tax=Rhizomucor pusillus TaxID=4840 RepID=UPI003743F932